MPLQENTIAYQMTIHRWGIKRQIKAGLLSEMLPGEKALIEKKMLTAGKRIIESPEYDKIVSQDGFATRWLAEHSVPSILKKGVYLIPVPFADQVDEYIENYKSLRHNGLVERFLEVYETQRQEAYYLLSGYSSGANLFDSLEYPTPEKMRTLFSVETSYITFDVPQNLQHVSSELFRREKERVELAWREAETAINSLLVQECTELVSGLQTALQGLNDGTLKRFREANLENLREWASLFLEARNVTDNAELAHVVTSLQSALAGVRSDDLRQDRHSLRSFVQEQLASSQIELKGMLENTPERVIEFD